MRYYVDANIFISATVNSEETKNAKSLLENAFYNGDELYTSYLTLDEVMWKVKRYLGAKDSFEAAEALLDMPNLSFIEVDAKIMSLAISLAKAHSLDPRDAIHAASMKKRGLKFVISKDSDFDKIAGIKRLTEKDLL